MRDTTLIAFRILNDVHAKLMSEAKRRHVSKSAVLRELIEAHYGTKGSRSIRIPKRFQPTAGAKRKA